MVSIPGEGARGTPPGSLSDVVAKVVKEQEGIVIDVFAEAEGAAQMHAGAFQSRFGLDYAFDRAKGHGGPPIP